MRTIKVFGLAMVAALVATAFGSVGSASAVTLCSVQMNPCPEGSRYPAETTLALERTASMILIPEEEPPERVQCMSSGGKIETLAESGTPSLSAEALMLVFVGCTTFPGAVECTVEAAGLPFELLITANEGAVGSGMLKGEMGGGNLVFECGMLTCIYAPTSEFEAFLSGGKPASIGNGVPMSRQPGSSLACSENASWSVKFIVTNPMALFVVASP